VTAPVPEPVRAMTARYNGACAMAECGAIIPRGHLMYRVRGHSLCHVCGRRYVDALPRGERKPRPS
jgi:hypothetical protein